mmetsp:Transcript_110759/g.220274  ORF Transcript_110759/g.220274 Transcript_110759/m.220274 type:complete len:252 (-) Transcript_110759:569-1324(-)
MYLWLKSVFCHHLGAAAQPASVQHRCQGETEQVLFLPHSAPHLAASLPGMTDDAVALLVSAAIALDLHKDRMSMALHMRAVQACLHHVPAEANDRPLNSLAMDLSSRGEVVARMLTQYLRPLHQQLRCQSCRLPDCHWHLGLGHCLCALLQHPKNPPGGVMLRLVRLDNRLGGFGAAVCKCHAVACKSHARSSAKGELIQKVTPPEAVPMHHQCRCIIDVLGVVRPPKVGLTAPIELVDASQEASVSEVPA